MTDIESVAAARREIALRFALLGLTAAIESLRDETGRAQVAAGQGAFWAATIDEQLQPLSWYASRRDVDDDGCVVPGLRLARNAVTHGAVVVSRSAGLVYPLFADGGALTFGPDIWKPLDELTEDWTPQGKAAKVEREKAAYELTVSGRRLEEPLHRAAQWFARLQGSDWRP